MRVGRQANCVRTVEATVDTHGLTHYTYDHGSNKLQSCGTKRFVPRKTYRNGIYYDLLSLFLFGIYASCDNTEPGGRYDATVRTRLACLNLSGNFDRFPREKSHVRSHMRADMSSLVQSGTKTSHEISHEISHTIQINKK